MTEDLSALAKDAVAASRAASDPDYPVFHVAPPVGRLNDPNGLLVDGGTGGCGRWVPRPSTLARDDRYDPVP